MKILLVEDNQASIESAKMQFPDCEITVLSTCFELELFFDKERGSVDDTLGGYDLVMTDMYLSVGNTKFGFGVARIYKSEDIFPAGLIVSLRAQKSGIPCLIVTDANSHHDMLGFMLDKLLLNPLSEKLMVCTRPSMIQTTLGKGKDWKGLLEYYRDFFRQYANLQK